MTKTLFLVLVLLTSGPVFGQDHFLVAEDEGASVGASVEVSITYQNQSMSDLIQGINYGLCTEDESVAVALDHVAGAQVVEASFAVFNVVVGGVVAGVVLSFDGSAVFSPGESGELGVAVYDAVGGGFCSLDFCDTLGAPPVPVGIADVDAQPIPVMTTSGSISTGVPPPAFVFWAPTQTVQYDGVTGLGRVDLAFQIALNPAAEPPPGPDGYNMAVANDPTLLQPVAVSSDPLAVALGTQPFFFSPSILDDNSGWTVGVIFGFGAELDFSPGFVNVAQVTYDITGPVPPLGNVATPLTFTTLVNNTPQGSFPVENGVAYGTGADFGHVFEDGMVTLIAAVPAEFIRGDCNQDITVNIADGITILQALFLGGTLGGCFEACEVNDDDFLDAADAVYVFNYMLLGGAMPPAPFPDCGLIPDANCASAICP